ncbi:Putative intracellular protease/amidase [Streptomyces sp. SceaMP-e96]|uniref:DJ-1/PfpI family protein n=1 Tax=unclassified Streptomyces TaxID=2593676 RepID=UPI000823B4E6|nr:MULTISPECIES: DJ-1/PfpI family protein [unclassified Streptomyces]MYT14037.1 glutamine amidotransferase [Streptomyces sp. SID4951]SCK57744.1 Putative intracellular protease/amidase [Streptomyces sp. SceaMP-e96]
MTSRTVHLAAYDTLADWEYGHAIGHLRSGSYFRPARGAYDVVTVAATTGRPVTTMGGQRIVPELALDALRPEDSALLILPGAELWDTGEELVPFAAKAREFLAAGVPVAAICGATAGLAREGLLDDRPHTSGAAPYLAAQPGYRGGGHYREDDAVRARGLITAGPTAPVAFAREIFAELDVMEPRILDAWFRLFAHSDAEAFPVLMTAGAAGSEAEPEGGSEGGAV